jgi:arsenite methyltransferase
MTGTAEDTREQVRARYAAAATAVHSGQGCGCGPSTSSGDDGCCGTGETGGCCSAASCAPETVEVGEGFDASLYTADEQAELPAEALAASLGCGNPLAIADLQPGETVLDLGSGGGIDVLLSARRVGPNGFAHGVDMTDEMLALARSNAEQAGATNVAFVKGTIEAVPLPASSIDAVISNCVINLSVENPPS